MALITTKIDLKEYKAQLERQKEVLKFSLIFNEDEKLQIAKKHDDLIEICNTKLLLEFEVSNPDTL